MLWSGTERRSYISPRAPAWGHQRFHTPARGTSWQPPRGAERGHRSLSEHPDLLMHIKAHVSLKPSSVATKGRPAMARPSARTHKHRLHHHHLRMSDGRPHLGFRILTTAPPGLWGRHAAAHAHSHHACAPRSQPLRLRGAVDAGIPACRLLPACNAIACLKRLLETPRSAFFAEVRRCAWAGRLGGGPGEEGRPPQRVNLQEASLWPLEVWPELLKHRTSEPRGGPWGRPGRVEPTERAAKGTTMQGTWLPLDETDRIAACIEFPVGTQMYCWKNPKQHGVGGWNIMSPAMSGPGHCSHRLRVKSLFQEKRQQVRSTAYLMLVSSDGRRGPRLCISGSVFISLETSPLPVALTQRLPRAPPLFWSPVKPLVWVFPCIPLPGGGSLSFASGLSHARRDLPTCTAVKTLPEQSSGVRLPPYLKEVQKVPSGEEHGLQARRASSDRGNRSCRSQGGIGTQGHQALQADGHCAEKVTTSHEGRSQWCRGTCGSLPEKSTLHLDFQLLAPRAGRESFCFFKLPPLRPPLRGGLPPLLAGLELHPGCAGMCLRVQGYRGLSHAAAILFLPSVNSLMLYHVPRAHKVSLCCESSNVPEKTMTSWTPSHTADTRRASLQCGLARVPSHMRYMLRRCPLKDEGELKASPHCLHSWILRSEGQLLSCTVSLAVRSASPRAPPPGTCLHTQTHMHSDVSALSPETCFLQCVSLTADMVPGSCADLWCYGIPRPYCQEATQERTGPEAPAQMLTLEEGIRKVCQRGQGHSNATLSAFLSSRFPPFSPSPETRSAAWGYLRSAEDVKDRCPSPMEARFLKVSSMTSLKAHSSGLKATATSSKTTERADGTGEPGLSSEQVPTRACGLPPTPALCHHVSPLGQRQLPQGRQPAP
ncbi:hypothetical protein Cadr_000025134 [Camelus dromedarius]|uniref:Uncharacterized protein n=1 Tax=Camelus dromedarius TaxID=9838 RepID=A0A5N4CLC9_CAMDR|nr:hypothetical protein Cadr_000025134 [Camelus dromedarius]